MPIYILFLKDHGLDPSERNNVNAVFFGLCLLLEMPTGALADMWGRKKCFVLAGCITTICFFVYSISTQIWHFVCAEILSAIGSTLASGCFFAWLTTRLKQLRSGIKPGDVLRRTYSITCITGIGASLISGRLGNMQLSWILAGIIFFISTIYSIVWMQEDHVNPHGPTLKKRLCRFRWKIRRSWRYARGHATIKFILVTVLLLCLATQAPNMQWADFFKGQFVSENVGGIADMTKKQQEATATLWSSYIWTGMMVFLGLGAISGKWIERHVKDEKWVLLAALFFAGMGITAATLMPSLGLMLMTFLLHEAARGLYKPLCDGYFNHQIRNEKLRATILSVGSLPLHLASVIGLTLSGFLALKTSISLTWIVSGTGLMVATILLTLWVRKRA